MKMATVMVMVNGKHMGTRSIYIGLVIHVV